MASLRVSANMEALGQIRSFVRQAADEAGLDRRAAYRLEVAVDEIATNVIHYGHPDTVQDVPTVDVTATSDDRSLTVVLEDSGPAFDPLAHALAKEEASLDRPMDERPIGGLGVLLAIRGVDEFRYERGAATNRNVFTVFRKPAAADAARPPQT